MTAGVPWSVSAVDPDTWSAARDAARRAGLSVGEWLEAAIQENARTGGTIRHHRQTGGLEHRLDDLSEQIQMLLERNAEFQPAPQPRDVRNDPVAASLDALTDRIDTLLSGMDRAERANGRDDISAAIGRLDSRIESLLAQRPAGDDRDAEVDSKLDEMSRVIEAMSERLERDTREVAAPSLAPTAAELDAAIADIIERQSALDGIPVHRSPRIAPEPEAPRFANLERQLKTIADEMQSLRKSNTKNGAVGDLRRDIADLARTMADLAPRRTLEALENAVDALVRRVDRSSFAPGQDAHATQTMLTALEEIRGALSNVRPAESFASVEGDLNALSNKLDIISAKSIDGTTVARIQNQIQEIRDLLANALPSEALQSLVGEIEKMAGKVERVASPNDDGGMRDMLGRLERRIDALAERIETGSNGRAGAGAEALEKIGSRLDALQHALDNAERPDPMGLEQTMRSVVERLDASEVKLSGLGTIERGISDLSEQFDKARSNAMEVAERAAKTALRELQASRLGVPQPQAAPAAPMPSAPVMPDAKPLAGEPFQVRNVTAVTPRDEPAAETLPRFTRPAPTTARANEVVITTDGLPADYPLEPGSGAPRSRPTPISQRIAQSEAAVADIAPRTQESSARTSDFIAAARRAAQAAASESDDQATAAEGKKGAIQGLFARSRRAILLGLAVAMIGFSAVRFFDFGAISNLIGAGPSEPVIQRPNASPPQTAPAPAPAAPTPEQRSALPDTTNLTAISMPAAGVLGPDITNSILTQIPGVPVTTQSTAARIPQANLPNNSLPQVRELPASIGNAALRAAAISGDPEAAFEIADRYLAGKGVTADPREAVNWLERATAKGSVVAAFRLGMAYEKGIGVAKDRAAARTHYTLAADSGHVKAMHNLAVMIVEVPGQDGKADYQSAIPWFRKAADLGLPDSQYNLGVLYARGLGVNQNLTESFRWFALAANQGDADAAKKRDDVAARLDNQTLVAAKLAVQTWVSQPINDSVNAAKLKPEWQKAETTPPKKKSKK